MSPAHAMLVQPHEPASARQSRLAHGGRWIAGVLRAPDDHACRRLSLRHPQLRWMRLLSADPGTARALTTRPWLRSCRGPNSRLPGWHQKSSKAGQFCTNPLQHCDVRVLRPPTKAVFFKYLALLDGVAYSRAVAWDLISCRFSRSGCTCSPPGGKGLSDTGQRQASAKVTVRCDDEPHTPNEPPDTPETPPDEPPPTPVEEPPQPGKGPYIAGLDPG